MTRTFIAFLTLCALCLVSSQPAQAAFGDVTIYDTVDEIKVLDSRIIVTGIVAGQSASTTATYSIANHASSVTGGTQTDVAASRCDRLALLAMSKPGRFQFGVTDEGGGSTRIYSCKLSVRTP